MTFVKTIEFQNLGDNRGDLVAIEENKTTPFPVRRVYYIYGTPPGVTRGFHAHKSLQQMAVCVSGSCSLLLDDGTRKKQVVMQTPTQGVMIEPMVWHEMYDFTKDCVLLVLASEHYDESDYIRDYEDFLEATRS